MRIRAFCGLPDGSEWLRDEVEEDASDPEGLGRSLAERMRAAGAADILGGPRRWRPVHDDGRESSTWSARALGTLA